MADIGWITGTLMSTPMPRRHSVLYEGVPQLPDAGRPGVSPKRLDVQKNIFHTFPPPAIRPCAQSVREAPEKTYHIPLKHRPPSSTPSRRKLEVYYETLASAKTSSSTPVADGKKAAFLCRTTPFCFAH